MPTAPEAQGEPAQSNAARPDWERGAAYAPQADPSVRLSAVAATGEVKGLVTCGVEADHQDPQGLFGKFRDPDLTTELTLDSAEIKAHGPEDNRTMRISAPLIHLVGGEAVQVKVYDRDVFKIQHIETLKGSYEGAFPFDLTGVKATAHCELVPQAVTEELAEPIIHEAHLGILAWEDSLRPDLQASDLGGPSGRPREAMRESAALLGWQDPRVQHLLEEHDRLVESYEALLTEQLLQATASSSTYQGVRINEARLLCGSAGNPYTIHPGTCAVSVQADGQGELAFPLTGISLVWSYGIRELELAGTGLAPDHKALPTVTVDGPTDLILVTVAPTDRAGPMYLRTGSPGSYQYLAVANSGG